MNKQHVENVLKLYAGVKYPDESVEIHLGNGEYAICCADRDFCLESGITIDIGYLFCHKIIKGLDDAQKDDYLNALWKDVEPDFEPGTLDGKYWMRDIHIAFQCATVDQILEALNEVKP